MQPSEALPKRVPIAAPSRPRAVSAEHVELVSRVAVAVEAWAAADTSRRRGELPPASGSTKQPNGTSKNDMG
jgi:hypothetical protein